jgi:hypothetical protein
LFSANSAIFQLYPGENKLIFNEMEMRKVREGQTLLLDWKVRAMRKLEERTGKWGTSIRNKYKSISDIPFSSVLSRYGAEPWWGTRVGQRLQGSRNSNHD